MLESFAIWAFFVISEDQNIFNIEKKTELGYKVEFISDIFAYI